MSKPLPGLDWTVLSAFVIFDASCCKQQRQDALCDGMAMADHLAHPDTLCSDECRIKASKNLEWSVLPWNVVGDASPVREPVRHLYIKGLAVNPSNYPVPLGMLHRMDSHSVV